MYQKRVNDIGRIVIGNFLSGRPAPDPTKAKRANDTPSKQPPKRPRTGRIEDDVSHNASHDDVCSIPSSSEVVAQPSSASSSHRRAPQDSQSQRTNGDKRDTGNGVSTLRNLEHFAGFGKSKRPRHRKSSGRQSFGSVDDVQGTPQKNIPSNTYRPPKPSLHYLHKIQSDPIQDDEDVTFPIESRSSGTNGRASSRVHGKYSHTMSHFAVPDTSSEDELNAPPPTVPQPKSAEQKQSIPEGLAKSARKRAAENDEIGQQPMHSAKRRSDNASKADMHRTKFSSGAKLAEGGHDALRVCKAVCGPTYVYPAEGTMHENMAGASNKTCRLVPATNGQSCFEAVDETGEVIPELEWITPNMVKVKEIVSNPNSPTVQLKKLKDFNTKFATGPTLYLEFGSSQEAEDYVKCCRMANDSIETGESRELLELSTMMQHSLEVIMERNMQKPTPPSLKGPDDIQVLEANAIRKMSIKLPNTAKTISIREQMRNNVSHRDEALAPINEPQGNLTPAQEKHLRDVVEDDYGPGQQQHGHDNTEIELRTPSRPNGHDHVPRSQRSLRSTKSMARSPSPLLERWTEIHRDWGHEWKTDLVYERTTVSKGDIERLDEGQLLNDEIISFYIKYLHKQLERKDEQLASKVYVFNSFFWDKLKPKRGDINYDGVKNWTAKVDLLSFDYIIVPINENAHWYLAIICNAKGLLHKEDPDSEEEVAVPKEDRGQAGDVTENMTDESVTKMAVDVSHISIDDESVDPKADQPVEDGKSPTGKGSKASKKGPGPRKYDPRAPKVITLDSLGGPHSSVVTALKRYLQSEIKHKKGLDVEAPVSFGTTAKDIPCQPNFTDCGVYLLGYMQEFMKDPDRFTRRILQSEKRDWDVNAPALRGRIRGLILRLQEEYQAKEDQTRRQKALAARQQPPKPQASGMCAPRPSAASRQPGERPSASSSPPATHTRQDTSPRAKSNPLHDVDKEATPFRRDKHSSPSSAADNSQEASPSHSDSSEHGTSNNMHNVSMIVNVDDSIERNDSESVSKPTVAALQRPMKSIEDDASYKRTPAPSRSPGRQRAPRSSEAKTPTPASGVFVQSLLQPIPSSPTSSDATTNKGGASRGGVNPGKKFDNKANAVSRYFQDSAHGNGNIRKRGHPKKGRVRTVEAISSSDTDEVEGKTDRKKPSPTIDLTLD